MVHQRAISSDAWMSEEGKINYQTTLTYNYCIISDMKKSLSSSKMSGFELIFPALFHRPQEEPEHAIVTSNECLENITRGNDISSMFSVKLKKSMSIEEAIIYRTKFERFYIVFRNICTGRCCSTINKCQLPTSRDTRPTPTLTNQENRTLSICLIKEAVDSLIAYVTNFEKIGYATHLHASFVEYGDRKTYLESRFSALFTGIDSIYSKLAAPPSKKELLRISEYDAFISNAEKNSKH